MRVFFVDTSQDRGQYGVLGESAASSFLLSFAYHRCLPLYEENFWMPRVHLAASGPSFIGDALAESGASKTLLSYAYKGDEKTIYEKAWLSKPDCNIIIDSGAFTAWSTGREIKIDEYAQWAHSIKDKWGHRVSSLEFMNLDVIGDQAKSWDNLAELGQLGINALPIVTSHVPLHHVERAVSDYDYIALGGLVPYVRNRKKLQPWLDSCFSVVMKHRQKTGQLKKVHLLGVTSRWVLERYPCFSCDSSSWVSCLRFGGGDAAGIKKIPRYKESDAALAATRHVLLAEIRKYLSLEKEMTQLWKTRGITF